MQQGNSFTLERGGGSSPETSSLPLYKWHWMTPLKGFKYFTWKWFLNNGCIVCLKHGCLEGNKHSFQDFARFSDPEIDYFAQASFRCRVKHPSSLLTSTVFVGEVQKSAHSCVKMFILYIDTKGLNMKVSGKMRGMWEGTWLQPHGHRAHLQQKSE